MKNIKEMTLCDKLDHLHWFVCAIRDRVSENQAEFHKGIVESLQAQFESLARHELEVNNKESDNATQTEKA